jgi:HCOMODA/2-hydroxy-3-carboxy-muconic semialdehyde decarboxylase
VRVHREIYRLRPDVNGIVRCMPPHVMTLAAHGVSPQPRHGFGSYFHPRPAFWDDPQLLRSDLSAMAAARELGNSPAIILRGNGAVVAGNTLQQAVVLAWYLEDMARIDLAGRAAGLADAPVLTADAATERATWGGAILERMWDYLVAGDEEATT